MMNNDYELARAVAKSNLAKIQQALPSRLKVREGRLLTSLKASTDTPLEKLEKLYLFMDELYAFLGKYTPCKKGCDHCCYIPVEVSLLEAEHIKRFSAVKQISDLTIQDFRGNPCPFLKESTCSVYKHRPFVCRRQIALFDDPKWCHLDVCDRYKFANIRFTEVQKSYEFILSSSGVVRIFDIRQLLAGA